MITELPVPLSTEEKEAIALEEHDRKYSPRLQQTIKSILEDLQTDQKTIRQQNIKEWKQLDYYWNGDQNRFWSDLANDWRPYEEGIRAGEQDLTEDDIGRVVNVYKGWLESVIAGLSASVPNVLFAPDNADDPSDLSTAKAYKRIADLVATHNNAASLLVRALFTITNQSFVASHIYYDRGEKYGTVQVPTVEKQEVEVEVPYCPTCGSGLEEAEAEVNEYEGEIFENKVCEICGPVIPDVQKEVQEKLVPTYVTEPKGRTKIDIYGPMEVQVPFYVKCLEATPYLILEVEHHVSLAKSLFPHLAKLIKPEGSYSSYERWARQPSENYGQQESDLVTFRRIWFRPSAYSMIEDADLREEVKAKYPTGLYVLYLNDLFAEAYEENMDDCWVISENPTSRYIHAAPLGRTVKDIQDMTNDMYNLTLRTILYGIPMTFAESNAIDWDKFAESPSEPGNVYPAKVQPGQNLSGMFHTVKTATLSREVDAFSKQLEQAGQFVSKAFPSIYGGAIQGGSGTYKEYESSRNQALQALGLIWKYLNIWWKDTIYKACKLYARNLLTDEYFAKRIGNSYINVWIKKSELNGKIGEVEPESSDQVPVSTNQKRDLMIFILTQAAQNPQLQQVLFHPENFVLFRLLGFGEIYIPGDDQRNKQLNENLVLMSSAPFPSGEINPETGEEVQVSSVQIESVDDDAIHIETVKAFLVSDAGQYLKDANPEGYQNCILHLQEHQQRQALMAQQQLEQQMLMAGKGQENGGPSNDKPTQ